MVELIKVEKCEIEQGETLNKYYLPYDLVPWHIETDGTVTVDLFFCT